MSDPRTALVTGAGQGLGLAISTRLARDGHRVVMGDVDGDLVAAAALCLHAAGHDVTNVAFDVTDEEGVERAFAATLGEGPLHVLVNNAGIISRTRAEEFDPARFDLEMLVNLGGTMRCSRAAYPYLVAAASPAVVNLASVGSTFGLPHRLGYSTAKTGIVGLTRTLAAEWGRSGIRVNAVAPGYIETPMMLSGFDSGALDRDRLLSRTPLMRFGRAEEIAAAVSFLVGPDASFVTGVVLEVDGGITIDGTFHRDERHRSTVPD
ncbi:SDR family NAD(P)-dependent oxidoreductase [Nocardioides sp. LS1]|uniref:SDR family NAD(P)-dependent oxidoreductase n=1 Tax=Nocardioides sp. LS1 TaxID=1027620 RepID=UPI000F61FAF5|nr:SDR family oxidoreductase [Nocardioides sp. LS1]GCD90021.1 3-oxoacyl-ACP reductase [Nocardioides sp. LS1]